MTTVQTFPEIRRHEGGSVDFDFYRAQLKSRRGQIRREERLVRRAATGLIVITLTFAAVLVVVAGRTYAPQGETAVIEVAPRFE